MSDAEPGAQWLLFRISRRIGQWYNLGNSLYDRASYDLPRFTDRRSGLCAARDSTAEQPQASQQRHDVQGTSYKSRHSTAAARWLGS